MATTPKFNVDLMVEDATVRGWLPTDLAKAAGVSDMTISRFLRKHTQTARTASKIAAALGYEVRRYMVTRPVRMTASERRATGHDRTSVRPTPRKKTDRRADERRDDERRDAERRDRERRDRDRREGRS